MNIKDMFAQFKNLLANAAGVEMSFGSPSQIGDIHIIPVAKVGFGFGGGMGNSAFKGKKAKPEDATEPGSATEIPEEKAEGNYGGGGGGRVKTDPVGIYTIKGDVVKFHPVISIKELLAVIGVISVLLLKVIKIKRQRKK